ncbi:hypothetical protein CAEBREN_21865 [Caenorhabditis brenneri]|uniref:Uncharacterized protein n=1 Tax=Caenorhabditis brenneri TaxID=135651 RepID=G0N7I7_CAEBE|nr:hypothetical protein CAEBREN_21865 [Caenorhabditis brenneri]
MSTVPYKSKMKASLSECLPQHRLGLLLGPRQTNNGMGTTTLEAQMLLGSPFAHVPASPHTSTWTPSNL